MASPFAEPWALAVAAGTAAAALSAYRGCATPASPLDALEEGIAFSEEHSEQAVIATMRKLPPGSRNRTVAEALVRHLHGFVKDVSPSIEEWEQAVEYLVRLGQFSADAHKGGRHEWMLVSDTLGCTMLVDCINHRKSCAPSLPPSPHPGRPYQLSRTPPSPPD